CVRRDRASRTDRKPTRQLANELSQSRRGAVNKWIQDFQSSKKMHILTSPRREFRGHPAPRTPPVPRTPYIKNPVSEHIFGRTDVPTPGFPTEGRLRGRL